MVERINDPHTPGIPGVQGGGPMKTKTDLKRSVQRLVEIKAAMRKELKKLADERKKPTP